MKIDGHGQSEPINEFSYKRIRKCFRRSDHQLIFDLAYYTGERWGAILKLRVCDIYRDVARRQLHECVTYRASTRKDGETRQVPIHPQLRLHLKTYEPPQVGYLFPSPEIPTQALGFRAADRALRRALERAGLDKSGYSTHSTRRGFITQLHDKGLSVKVIQSLTGHKSLAVLSRYIEVSEQQRQSAIALLS